MHGVVGEADVLGLAAQQAGGHRLESLAHLRRGIHDGSPVDVGSAGSRGGGRVGHLLRIGGGHTDFVHADTQTIGTHLGHLGVEALSHFGASMVDADRAVHVDHQQRATLVQVGGGEADAELQGHQSQAALAGLALGIEGLDGCAALGVAGLRFHLSHDLVAHPVLDQLVVLGGHGVGRATDGGVLVEVELAHLEGVLVQGGGNFVDHGFDAEHALWTAKAPKRGGALGVGLAAMADQLERRDVVGVVDVQTGTVVDRPRVIGAVAAA